MNSMAKKITTAAVSTALAVVFCVMAAYLPLSFMPLYFAAFCLYIAYKRANFVYGLLATAAAIGLTFLMSGLSGTFFMLAVMFAPYAIYAFFMDRFDYVTVKNGIIRAVAGLVFFNVCLFLVYLTATQLVAFIANIDIAGWAAKVGGYAVLAVIGSVLFLPLDFMFVFFSKMILKRIK